MIFTEWEEHVNFDSLDAVQGIKEALKLHGVVKDFSQRLSGYIGYMRYENVDTAIDRDRDMRSVKAVDRALQELQNILEEE